MYIYIYMHVYNSQIHPNVNVPKEIERRRSRSEKLKVCINEHGFFPTTFDSIPDNDTPWLKKVQTIDM